MKIGLTGPQGMIGRHMTAVFDAQGIEYAAVGREKWDLSVWQPQSNLNELFGDVDAIFHFGAYLPKYQIDADINDSQTAAIFDVNVRSCLNLAEWALASNIPLVFLSGSTVYANAHASSINEDAPKVVNGFGGFYGYSKLLAEHVIAHYAGSGLNVIILRPSSVYGCGLGKDKLIQRYLSQAMSNKPIVVHNYSSRINFIHAYDVAHAALSAFKAKSWGVYNIATHETVSIADLAETCIRVVDSSSNIQCDKDSGESAPFVRFDLDCANAKRAFKFKPRIDLCQGIMMMSKGVMLPC